MHAINLEHLVGFVNFIIKTRLNLGPKANKILSKIDFE